MAPHRVIVDVDVGTDDYLALLVLFYGEKLGVLKIEAICCSMGNTTLDYVCKNVVRLLELIGRTDVPVYKGARDQLILPKEKIPIFHGPDGFGNLKHDTEPNLAIIRETPSAIAINGIVAKYPKEISLMFLGPLTNLALAIKMFPDFVDNVKDLWIMGGNYTGLGNVTASAEFNFFVDPEAVHIVLECMTCPMYLLPWESCIRTTIPSDWRYKSLGHKSAALNLLTRAEGARYKTVKTWAPCDALLAFAYLKPQEYIIDKTHHHALIELHSTNTRGQIVIDHLKKKSPNIWIIETVAQDKFMDILLEIENCI